MILREGAGSPRRTGPTATSRSRICRSASFARPESARSGVAIGDTLASYNHPDIAAAILKPFVDEKTHWMVEHHGIFQGYYFFHHLGMNRDMREAFRGHEHFEDTARFCELYDQSAFDPGYESATLDFFEPMVRRVFAQPINSIYKSVAE